MAFNLAPVPPGRSQAHRQLQQQPGPAQFHQPLGGGYGAYGQFPGSPGHQFGGAPQQFAPAGGRPQGGRMVPQQFAAPMNLPQTPQSPQSPPGWNSWDSPGSSQPFGPLSPGNSMLMSPHSGQVMSPQQHPWRFGGQLDQDTEMVSAAPTLSVDMTIAAMLVVVDVAHCLSPATPPRCPLVFLRWTARMSVTYVEDQYGGCCRW